MDNAAYVTTRMMTLVSRILNRTKTDAVNGQRGGREGDRCGSGLTRRSDRRRSRRSSFVSTRGRRRSQVLDDAVPSIGSPMGWFPNDLRDLFE